MIRIVLFGFILGSPNFGKLPYTSHAGREGSQWLSPFHVALQLIEIVCILALHVKGKCPGTQKKHLTCDI